MARLSLSLLLLLSLLSVSFARDLSQLDSQPEPTFLAQLPNPESESESEREPVTLTEGPEFPIPEQEERRESEIPELPTPEPEEKPEFAETVQYIVLPVHQLQDASRFDNIEDIGFSLRLPMHHGHRHHRHGFRFFNHRFGPRFGHRFHRRFPARENQMEGFPEMNDEEGRKLDRPEMPEMPMRMQMKEDMEVPPKFFFNNEKTQMPVMDEEKIEIAKGRMRRMRRGCKHHHMEKGMHWPHDHHHEHHHEPREEMRVEREEMRDDREGMHWPHDHHHEHHREPREEMRVEREEMRDDREGMHWHHGHHHEHHHEPREEMRDEREGMHWHHGHHHEHHHGPREEMRDEREEGGFMKQLWNIFNF